MNFNVDKRIHKFLILKWDERAIIWLQFWQENKSYVRRPWKYVLVFIYSKYNKQILLYTIYQIKYKLIFLKPNLIPIYMYAKNLALLFFEILYVFRKMALNQENVKKFTQKSKQNSIFLALEWTILSFWGPIGIPSDIDLDLINQSYRLAWPIMARKNTFLWN